LHGNLAFGEARQLAHRTGVGQHQRVLTQAHGRLSLGRQPAHIDRARAAPGIHAQGHRRVAVGLLQQDLPVGRPVVLEALDPPQGVVEGADGLTFGGSHQSRALTNEAPQHGIDEADGSGRALVRGLHGLVDQGVVGVGRADTAGRRPEQCDRGHQQCIDRRRRRLGGHDAAHGLCSAQPAQGLESQRLRPATGCSRHAADQIGERAALADPLHHVGGVVQQVRQSDRGRRG
jgi:hypothetical protein